ncbi:MAG: AarF/ABC1/UbiB kinase family protein [Anaerolineales bacterium]|nr:AarF/ABC1/UbiB kinase family protein [Chloroflexota bacterium]MBL6980031.1 AarF/ABC1/UbiB kinase family protein [Anaerolineales bacterium]
MSTSDDQNRQIKLRKGTKRAIKKNIQNWQGIRAQNGSCKNGSGVILPEGKKPQDRSHTDVISTIPRREISSQSASDISLPVVEPLVFKTSRIKALGRLFIWLSMIFYFIGGNIWDRLRRRDSETRRAIRLRRAFERAGGTFIKFGQQMAMRIDLLPWAYTVELSKMLDRVPPFAIEQALEIIERTTGFAWEDIFSIFDPDPIGSASIANVYQAILKSGEKVAVKVRRPGIGELFMADFKVFDWLLDLAEFLTLVRPGYTQNIRRELQNTLLEELDFVQEARFQDMFRRSAKKTKKGFFTAPRVYFKFSSQEVIVQKYTSGIWLWEIMAGVEQKNIQALARMRELNIDPQKVAQRLLWVNYWGMQENLIFHADPHPANVIVRRNSKLTFIDFGSCGSFNREQRLGLELTAMASGENDAEGMARGTLKLFEPLPPLDVKELFQQAEAEYTRVLTIFKSKLEHTEWWERTSVRQWMSFFKFSRDHNIPVAIHTLRMIRATLLYDTVAVRICKEVNRFDEYLRFRKFREKQAKKRVIKGIENQFRRGLDDTIFLRLEEVAKTGEKLLYRTQNFLGSPMFNFSSLVGKWVFTVSMVIRLIGRVLLITLITAGILAGVYILRGFDLQPETIFNEVVSNRFYLFLLVVLLITNTRHILFRLRDQEV